MESIPEVSVCVLTYNHEAYVRQALDSVINQKTTFRYEILVSDDASSDETVKIVREEYSETVKLNVHEENCGICRNMYDVLKMAKGKYVAVVAGDDYVLTDNYLQIHYDFMERNKGFVGVTNGVIVVNEAGEEQSTIMPSRKKRTLYDFLWLDTKGVKYDVFLLNIFKEDGLEWLYLATRNIDEITFPFWCFLHGNIAIMPKYMTAYRSVKKKNGSNYNSRFDPVDTYCFAEEACKYVEEKRVIREYKFKYFMGAHAESTAYFVIAKLKRHDGSYLRKWIERCGWRPFIKGAFLIPLFKLSGDVYPGWYRKCHSLKRKRY